jgi:hypothetical protein
MSETTGKTTRITIGGVPEHSNLPWRLAIEEGRFAKVGVELDWVDCPGGTGEMTQALADGDLDLALPLSEGAIAGIARGLPLRILQWYVRSPLIWGIHVPAHSGIESVDALRGRRFAISRYGSGSHLMAFVHAQASGWRPAEGLSFVVVGDLAGAIVSFKGDDAEGFLWERFTTQPYVDRGLMRRVGECPTPWPAFALAASHRALARSSALIERVAEVINAECSGFKARADIVETIARRYGLDVDQTAEWFALTEWARDRRVERGQLQHIISVLRGLDLLEAEVTPEDCCAPGCHLVD